MEAKLFIFHAEKKLNNFFLFLENMVLGSGVTFRNE